MNNMSRLYSELRHYKRSRALSVAIRRGVLKAMSTNPASLAELSSRTGIAEAWPRPLLGVLQDLELISLDESEFCLTQEGAQADADPTLTAFAGYHFNCFDAWRMLPDHIEGISGGGFHRARIEDPDFCRAYLESMDCIAGANIEFLRRECNDALRGAVLDIGAGPATLCRSLAEDNSIFLAALDLPLMVHMARRLYGESDHIRWIEADFTKWLADRRYDAAFCSHFLEYCPRPQLPRWLDRIKNCIKPDGNLVLVSFLRSNDGSIEPELDMFELSAGLNGEMPGHLCTVKELAGALQKAGFKVMDIGQIPEGPSYSEFLVRCKVA